MSAGLWVVVNYPEGNPDHPLISGCVPNKITVVPYPLPAHKTKTVLRSKSSPANGGYNELSIEDRAGQELIYLRAVAGALLPIAARCIRSLPNPTSR